MKYKLRYADCNTFRDLFSVYRDLSRDLGGKPIGTSKNPIGTSFRDLFSPYRDLLWSTDAGINNQFLLIVLNYKPTKGKYCRNGSVLSPTCGCNK